MTLQRSEHRPVPRFPEQEQEQQEEEESLTLRGGGEAVPPRQLEKQGEGQNRSGGQQLSHPIRDHFSPPARRDTLVCAHPSLPSRSVSEATLVPKGPPLTGWKRLLRSSLSSQAGQLGHREARGRGHPAQRVTTAARTHLLGDWTVVTEARRAWLQKAPPLPLHW